MSDRPAITLTRLGETMDKGTIVGWLKKAGEDFKRGETLVEVETDKTVVELPALTDGTLVEILADAGAVIAVGAPIAFYDGEPAWETDVEEKAVETRRERRPERVRAGPVAVDGKRRASPAARRLARELGRPLGEISGTGRRGRITTDDVRAASDDGEPVSIDVDGWPVRYLALGQGRQTPILLVHGFGGDLYTWILNHKRLAEHRRVYAVDLPGHGGSALDVEACTMDDMARSLGGFLDRLGLSRVHFVGLSMGGAAALRLVLDRPDIAASMLLIAPAALGSECNANYLRAFTEAKTVEALDPLMHDLFGGGSPYNKDLVAKMLLVRSAEGYLDGLRAIVETFLEGDRQGTVLRDRLGELAFPLKVLWGAEDRVIPASQAAGLPGMVGVHLFDGAGHMLPMERADQVNRLILEIAATG